MSRGHKSLCIKFYEKLVYVYECALVPWSLGLVTGSLGMVPFFIKFGPFVFSFFPFILRFGPWDPSFGPYVPKCDPWGPRFFLENVKKPSLSSFSLIAFSLVIVVLDRLYRRRSVKFAKSVYLDFSS